MKNCIERNRSSAVRSRKGNRPEHESCPNAAALQGVAWPNTGGQADGEEEVQEEGQREDKQTGRTFGGFVPQSSDLVDRGVDLPQLEEGFAEETPRRAKKEHSSSTERRSRSRNDGEEKGGQKNAQQGRQEIGRDVGRPNGCSALNRRI